MAEPIVRPLKAYEPEASGLRGLAVLMVVAGHFVQRVERFNLADHPVDWKLRLLIDSVACPAAGVYLFFAVSGYLIARSLSGIRSLRTARLGRFYLRRALRITPPYALILIVTWAGLTALDYRPPRTNLYDVRPHSLHESLLASVSYLHGAIYGTYPRLFPPGWTIEVEIQFYVLAPFLCLATRSLSARFGLGIASTLILGVSGGVALASLRSGLPQLQPTILVYMPVFLLGVVAYHVRRSGWRPTSRFTGPLGWIALIGFATLQPWISGLGVEIAARMALIALLFSAVTVRGSALHRLCTHPIMVRIGAASYSIYLVNLQIMHVVSGLIAQHLNYMPLTVTIPLSIIVDAVLIYAVTKFFLFRIEHALTLASDALAPRGRRLFQAAP